MTKHPVTPVAAPAVLQSELNRQLLRLLRAALLICLLSNILLGTADYYLETQHHPSIAALRFALIAAVVLLWVASFAEWAVPWAVPLSLLAWAVGCIQNVGPPVMHGEVETPIIFSLALLAALSTAAPWGVGGQLAAVVIASLTTTATIAVLTGDVALAYGAYPPTATAVVFTATLFAASVCRRTAVLSVERDVALRHSNALVTAREAQIHDQLVQLDLLYNTAPVGFALIDRNLRYVRINDTLAEMNGLPAAAHLGRTLREVLPHVADELETLCRSIFETGQPALQREVEGTTARAPGVIRYWRSSFWPLHNSDGQVTAVSCVVQEVTDQRRAQEALARMNADLEDRVRHRTAELEAANRHLAQESAERQAVAEQLRRSQKQLQDILDNATTVIYLKDTDGRYRLINSQFESLFHVNREQVVGQSDHDIFPHAAAEAFRRNDRTVLLADAPLSFEETVPHDDGDHTYVSIKFPLHDERGVAYGVCGISTDITPRKQMEAELQLSQAQLSALIESTGDAIWSINSQSRLVTINRVARRWFAEVYGGSPQTTDEIENQSRPEERKFWLPLYERALAGERFVIEREYTVAGERRSYLFSLTPIVADGEITGATVYGKDLTDRRRTEERLNQYRAELSHVLRLHTIGEMAAGLAHEINQPLAAIANYARGCRNRIVSGQRPVEDLLPVLEEIATQALRAGEIIRRLRVMVEKRDPIRERVDVNRVVSEAVKTVEFQVRQQGVVLDLEFAPGMPIIEIDPIQIGQVVVNLLLNGLEAMAEVAESNRHLLVRTSWSPDTIEILVCDGGSGLPSGSEDRLFEPFFTMKSNGLGMGLTISRSIVEGHGGRIWAENNPGGGASVHVVLPRANTMPVRVESVVVH